MFKSVLLWNIKYGFRFKSTRKVINPGVQKRMDIFKDESPEIDKLKLEEMDLEQYESDFYGAAKFHEEHEKDKKKLKRLIEFKRVERKYFNNRKNYNLLTWSEKEQIRYLSNSDPATWTPEKLSLSFPATVEIIKKILKASWKPQNAERIKKHDEHVSNNWKAIKRGEIELPPSFQEHIQKFMSRDARDRIKSIPVNEAALTTERNISPPARSEFVNIIRSYSKKNQPENNSLTIQEINTQGPKRPIDFENDTFVLEDKNPVPLKYKYYTLEALRKEIKLIKNNDGEQSEITEHFLKGNISNKSVKRVESVIPQEFLPSAEDFGNLRKNEMNLSLEIEKIPKKINIPKDKMKKGSVYKVNDCYYDDEGEFLYKVPGMS